LSSTVFFPLAASHLNLRRLLIIRLIVVSLQLLALAYAGIYLELSINYPAIVSTLIVFVLINAAVFIRLKKAWPISDSEFLLHLMLDVIGLSLVLYFSGGASNPFVSYYLVPITIAAAILPWKFTWLIAATSLLAYSLLLFFYDPLPEVMPMSMQMEDGVLNLHILGMWFNFLVSAALITYFVVKMASEIRSKEHRLNRYRENNLRDEQILAVATQAAGTAHELGTPLNTVSILVGEMQKQYPDNENLQQELGIIREQLSRCKSSLKNLVSEADLKKSGSMVTVALKDFIHNLLDQWRLIRPEVKLKLNFSNTNKPPDIYVDSTLQQAIVNILNNAADASPQDIDVEVFWNKLTWGLRIRDYGEGLSEEIQQELGTAFITTKESGMGVGLILSQASINRLGGTVSMQEHEQGGILTEISLPLSLDETP
tara:strand:+ start:106987 stop:108270 length:1284 start_codon:yes stop_codon:yes gene_type:complete